MSIDETKDLLQFIRPYPKEVQEIALWLRAFVWKLYPRTNELIYDNYNAVAFGWSPTDRVGHVFCSIAVVARYCNFGFYWGSEIADPEKKLLGNGSQFRYIRVDNIATFPQAYMKKLLKEAYANSLAKVKDESQLMLGMTIVKSVSAKKKRPGITPVKKKK